MFVSDYMVPECLVILILSHRCFLRMDGFETHRRETTRIDELRHFLLRLAEPDNNAKNNEGEAKNLLGLQRANPLPAGGENKIKKYHNKFMAIWRK